MAITPPFNPINLSVHIQCSPAEVWWNLTTPGLMKGWMVDPGMELGIYSDWKVGSPITMKGSQHGMGFTNTGTITAYEPEKEFAYTHLSSISHLPEKPENYCHLRFTLNPIENGTQLALHIQNFPTESIYKHMDFYWRGSMEILKEKLEAK